MTERFISQALEPVTESADTARMAAGEPGVPAAFRWRGELVEVREVLRSWRDTGPCTHGSGEKYVRRHWFELETSCGRLKVYFERKPRGGRRSQRWWLYSMVEGGTGESA